MREWAGLCKQKGWTGSERGCREETEVDPECIMDLVLQNSR